MIGEAANIAKSIRVIWSSVIFIVVEHRRRLPLGILVSSDSCMTKQRFDSFLNAVESDHNSTRSARLYTSVGIKHQDTPQSVPSRVKLLSSPGH